MVDFKMIMNRILKLLSALGGPHAYSTSCARRAWSLLSPGPGLYSVQRELS
jgi:hypothetical protein